MQTAPSLQYNFLPQEIHNKKIVVDVPKDI